MVKQNVKIVYMKKLIFISLIVVLIAAGALLFTSAQPTGQIIWQKEMPKTVYLTFDDGPDRVNTPKVLDILKENQVKATFFVLGHKTKSYPEIVKRIHDEGHLLGNHTFTHIDGYVVDEEIIKKEFESTHRVIVDACGVEVKLWRPPYGFFNWRAFQRAKKMGYKIVLWTFDLTDWNVHSAEKYVETVADNLEDGAIILMHDGGPKRAALIKALPKIITLIKNRGYRFSTAL